MRPQGRGILPQSQIFLYETPLIEKRIFFHALCVGHYECGSDYVVKRESYDSFLLLYVVRGGAYCVLDGRRTELGADSFALIDCYRLHEYGAVGSCELYWIHFDGPTAREFYDAIRAGGGEPVPRNFDRSRRALIDIFERTAARGPIEAAELNRLIVNLLTEFLVKGERIAPGGDVIEEIRNYILDNPAEDLTLEALARRANLSPYHFARQFKRQVGTTPHDYLIHTRLNLAKFYLLSTNNSVKEIAYSCGFANECGFCTSFKKHLGMTPSRFRSTRAK